MNKTSRLAVLVVVALAVAGFLTFRPRPHGPPQVGDPAPGFTLPCLAQSPVSLRDYRGQVVVLNFWATWCPPCVEEAPTLEMFSQAARKMGVTVIGVSVDQDKPALEKFVAEHRLSFPIARDPDQAVASRFGTSKFPETYIIDRDGKVAEKIIGAFNWQDPRISTFVEGLARPVKPAD